MVEAGLQAIVGDGRLVYVASHLPTSVTCSLSRMGSRRSRYVEAAGDLYAYLEEFYRGIS